MTHTHTDGECGTHADAVIVILT